MTQLPLPARIIGFTWLALMGGCFGSSPPPPPTPVPPQQSTQGESAGDASVGSSTAETAGGSLEIFDRDLRYVPPYAYAVAIVRPAALRELPDVRAIPGANLLGAMPVRLGNVQRAAVAVFPDAVDATLNYGVVLEFTEDLPRQTVVEWLSPGAEPLPNNEDVYYYDNRPVEQPTLGFPEDGVVLVGGPTFVINAMAQTENDVATSRLYGALRELDPAAQAVALVDVDRLRHFLAVDDKPTPINRIVKQVDWPAGVDFVAATVDLANANALQLSIDGARDDAALDELARATQEALLERLRAAGESFRQRLGEPHYDAIARVEDAWTGWLKETQLISAANGRVSIRSGQLPKPMEVMTTVAQAGALQIGIGRFERRARASQQSLKQIGLGLHNHHDALGQLPRDILSDDDEPLLSWRVAVLPWLGEDLLFQEFHLDEPWDSAHNKELLELMPDIFRSRDSEPGQSTTHFQLVTGPGTAVDEGVLMLSRVPDGTEFTLALIEAKTAVDWSKPDDFVFQVSRPAQGLRSDGSHALMYDGTSVNLDPSLDGDLLRRLFRCDDGEDVSLAGLVDGWWETEPPAARLLDADFAKVLRRIGDGSAEERLAALRKLRRRPTARRGQAVHDAVTPQLKSTDPDVRTAALLVLMAWRDVGKLDWRRLIVSLTDEYEVNRWLAIELLSNSREPEVVRGLCRLPAHDWGIVAPLLYDNFQAIAANAVAPLLDDPNARARLAAAHVMADYGNEEHRELVEKLLQDEDEECRRAATELLAAWPEYGPLRMAVADAEGMGRAAIQKLARESTPDRDGNLVAIDLSEDGDRKYEGYLRDSDLKLLAETTVRLQALDLTSTQTSADGVAHLRRLKELRELEINFCARIDDGAAVEVAKIESLEVLAIEQTLVGDRGAAALSQLANLSSLTIDNTLITDRGLEDLSKLTELTKLSISGTLVTDEGVAALAKHPNLRELYMVDTELSDAGLKSLESISTLRFINLRGTQVSNTAIAKLITALPECEVIVD
ncbi:MAG: DUF1559 domain-containing protein [Pirellulaceae bacterium]|jgi:hypothetical protein|nr:DUF1559 domain-containing protein [Pirellulaceae bacterium]